jgi:outer membrane protein assembly factor BamB
MKYKAAVCIFTILAFTLFPLTSADWPMFRSDLAHDGIGSGNAIYNPTLLRNYTTGDNVNSSPSVVSGIVYVSSYDGHTYALNATTGQQVLNYSMPFSPGSSPAISDGVVYVTTMGDNDSFLALNATDGTKIWSNQIGDDYGASPIVSNGTVYIGERDSYSNANFFALNCSNGRQIWNYTMGGITSAPAIDKGVVYIGANDGNAYALNAADGKQIWNFSTHFQRTIVASSPAVVNGLVYKG